MAVNSGSRLTQMNGKVHRSEGIAFPGDFVRFIWLPSDASRLFWPSRCRTCSCLKPRRSREGRPPPMPPSASIATCRRSCEEARRPSKTHTSSGRAIAFARPRWAEPGPGLMFSSRVNYEHRRAVGVQVKCLALAVAVASGTEGRSVRCCLGGRKTSHSLSRPGSIKMRFVARLIGYVASAWTRCSLIGRVLDSISNQAPPAVLFMDGLMSSSANLMT